MNRRDFIKLAGVGSVVTIPSVVLALPDTPTSIEELTRMIEARHKVGKSTVIRYAVTGEEYIVLANGMLHPEGGYAPYAISERQALKSAWDGYLIYSELNPDSILYWRTKPEVNSWDYSYPDFGKVTNWDIKTYHEPHYRIYMRLLLSKNPVIRNEIPS